VGWVADLRRRRRLPAVPSGTVAVADSDAVPSVPPFLEVKVAGERVLLARLPTGDLVAFPAACPHLGQPLRKAELDGVVLTCRHHRYRYDLADGRCVWPGGPHDEPLGRRQVGEVDGRVWVALASPAGES
jgi:phenylpropionate dioxygenase-like ring-hydroxylating dioxygenase large terminal subunit